MEGYKKIQSEEEYHNILKENEYVFVIFSAVWCGPCKSLKNLISEEYVSYPYPIVIVDIDEFEDLAEDVEGLPTMVGFHKNEEFIRTVGFDKNKIKGVLDEVIENKE